ncbi:MAG: chromate efflux transporter [Candidatus Entotheonellia bacterium]
MNSMQDGAFARNWKEIAVGFLKLGVTSYGGPAMMGIMQAELQEKRQWLSKERFLEGLSLVNMVPGATAAQLGIFLGHARGGWWGGLLAGLGFVLPGFCIMLALSLTYAHLGATPIMRSGLYGLGPVVLGIFMVAVYRLGRTAVTTLPQVMIALTAAAAAAFSPLGIGPILALAGGVGILLFHSRRVGALVLTLLTAFLGVMHMVPWSPWPLVTPLAQATGSVQPTGLTDLGLFFFKVGAFIFGGGLTMIAFMQEQVVNQFHWLTQQEFIDGLALGQFTPGPLLMVAAYVGYKVAGLGGAAIAATAIFLPSFILMLSILPMFERVRTLVWTKAAMRGVGPAVIGVLAVSLLRIAPHALPDPFAIVILMGTLVALLAWRIGAFKLMLAGAGLGVLRSRLLSLPGVRATLRQICSTAGV